MSTAEQMFIADLKRVLYNMAICSANLTWLKDNKACPSRLKYAIGNTLNSHKRLWEEIRPHYGTVQIKQIEEDLNSDRIKDINLLHDFAASINNVGEVVEVLQEQLKINDNGEN